MGIVQSGDDTQPLASSRRSDHDVNHRQERNMATRTRAKRASKRSSAPVLRRHHVSATIGVQELSKAGTSIKLFVHRDELKLGELDIGRGAIYWRGGNKKKWERVNWSRFAEMMNRLTYRKTR
jgi:hypothetical protein